MTTEEAIKYAGGSTALALMLRVTPGAVSQWGRYPPDNRQLQLQKLTRRRLKAEPGCMERLIGCDVPRKQAGAAPAEAKAA